MSNDDTKKIIEEIDYIKNSVYLRDQYLETKNERTINKIDDSKTMNDDLAEKYWKKISNVKNVKQQEIVPIPRDIAHKLENFRKKLVNISTRNRMIWIGKENKSSFLDLFNLPNKVLSEMEKSLRSESEKAFALKVDEEYLKKVNLRDQDIFDNKDEEYKIEPNFKNWNFNHFKRIYDTQSFIFTEKGLKSVYFVNYFLETIYKNKSLDLPVRAPIFLFPVDLSVNVSQHIINLNFNNKQSVIVNKFILEKIFGLEEFDYNESLTQDENLNNLLEKANLKSEEIKISHELEKFQVKNRDNITQNERKITIVKHSSIGIFNKFENPIEKYISDILNKNLINVRLLDFLSEKDLYTSNQRREFDEYFNDLVNNDNNIFYIDKLNFQQLEAIKKINYNELNHLSIWGPPGTGKSQVIVSIIYDQLVKNKRIAVVAEKKVALDVIYQRLGKLQASAIKVFDLEDKKMFYSQIENSFEAMKSSGNVGNRGQLKDLNEQILELKAELESELNRLDELNLNQPIKNQENYRIVDFIDSIKEFYSNSLESKELEINHRIIDIWNKEKTDRNSIKNIINSYNKLTSFSDNEYKLIFKLIKENIQGRNNDQLIDELSYKIIEIKKINRILENIEPEKIFKNLKKILKGKSVEDQRLFEILTYDLNLDKSNLKNKNVDVLIQEAKRVIEINNQRIVDIKEQIDFIRENYLIYKGFFDLTPLDREIMIFKDDYKNEFELVDIYSAMIKKFVKENINFNFRMDILDNYKNIMNNIKVIENQIIAKNKVWISIHEALKFNDAIESSDRISLIKTKITKKTKQSIPKFMSEHGKEIKEAYKIWLMQPEVLVELFKNDPPFDVILIDESSQIFLERSIPIIPMAKKLVVLGDEKQLAPSDFFQGRDEGEEEFIEEFDNNVSLLSYAKNKFPEIMLKNHYRSNHQELIDFSNKQFYNKKLFFISKNQRSDIKPIEYIEVKNARYVKNINQKNAQVVAKTLITISEDKLLKNKTVGIITLNTKQVDLINDFIEHFAQKDRTFSSWLESKRKNDKDGLFVKSIENVQGDERDIIILDTMYGPNEDGIQRFNFGPITREGGENRINVAITRSKDKMYIINSINLKEAFTKSKEAKWKGTGIFINYILYVKKINDSSIKEYESLEMKKIIDSKFKQKLYNNLKQLIEKEFNLTLTVPKKNYGYKIDFVIVDKHEQILYGIKIDEEKENWNLKSREREITKNEFLINRGWKIFKLWSINYLWNPEKEINILIEELHKQEKLRKK